MTDSRPSTVLTWIKFNAVGIGGVGVQLAALTFFVSVVALPVLPATFLAVETAVLHNFIWHECWTWAHRTRGNRGGLLGRLVRFNLANGAISLAGNVALMWLLVQQAGLHFLPANILSIVACSVVNFLAGDRLVFRR